MKELDWKNLGIYDNGMVHIDNYGRANHRDTVFKTWCGIISPMVNELTKLNYCSNIKLCKKCSNIYDKKYKEPFVSYIITLKLKDKLFT